MFQLHKQQMELNLNSRNCNICHRERNRRVDVFCGEICRIKQFDGPETIGYIVRVNRNLNLNLLLIALLLRRAAVGF